MDNCRTPMAMDRQLDVLHSHPNGGLLLGASCLTGRYWLGSLWFYQSPAAAPDIDKCTAGVQLEAGVCSAQWVDDTLVIIGLDTGGVALWNLEDEYRTFVLAHAAVGHDATVSSISVSCDKTKATSGSWDRRIKIWDLSSAALVYSSLAHSKSVLGVDCHPSETEIFVSCSQDGRVLLWDRRKPKPARIINQSAFQHVPTCVQWHPKEVFKMAVGWENGQIALLDTRMGVDSNLICSPHSRSITNLQFSPDEPSHLASVGEDCKLVVTSYDDECMKEIYVDDRHTDFVRGLTWGSRSHLYTCGWDSQVLHHSTVSSLAKAAGVENGGTLPVNGNVSEHPAQLGGGDAADSTKIETEDSIAKPPKYGHEPMQEVK